MIFCIPDGGVRHPGRGAGRQERLPHPVRHLQEGGQDHVEEQLRHPEVVQPVEGDVRGGRAGAAEHGGVLVWQVPPHLGHSQRGQLAPAETLPRSVSPVYRITLVQISCLLSIIFE